MIDRLLRDLAPQVLGAVVRHCGDFAAAEDAVQEALIAAATQWPRDGVPDNPRAWLIHVARRRMTDYARSDISRRNREAAVADLAPLVVAPATDGESAIDPDDTLVLLFMCCHPALTSASAIALTLRAVGGLTTAEIAKAFLVPESTIGQRISRAKQSIKAALMLLTDARRAARTGPHGELIPLDEQDRTLWDRQAITEGVALASAALSKGSVGEYQLQAAIAAVHDDAARAVDTDWPQIRVLYGTLLRMTDNPVVALNHAIATAMVDGPRAGLALLAPLMGDERLRGSHRLDAARAHLLERAGERDAAVALYREAASKTTSLPERNYLLMKAGRVAEAKG